MSPVELAQLVIDALDRGNADEAAASVARRAGLLLSEISRDLDDGSPLTPGQAMAAVAPRFTFESLAPAYERRLSRIVLTRSKVPELQRAVQLIFSASAIARYKEVSDATNIPWYVVAALHYREASLNFMGHLHNGDPLFQRTFHVPPNRPPRPWPPNGIDDPRELWRLSAIDALKELQNVGGDWSPARLCYAFEAYNGFGYQNRLITRNPPARAVSPYVWNYTQHYVRGGFPRDGYFDPAYISKQAGLVAIIAAMRLRDGRNVNVPLRIEIGRA
jgi:lysozyme family protein